MITPRRADVLSALIRPFRSLYTLRTKGRINSGLFDRFIDLSSLRDDINLLARISGYQISGYLIVEKVCNNMLKSYLILNMTLGISFVKTTYLKISNFYYILILLKSF